MWPIHDLAVEGKKGAKARKIIREVEEGRAPKRREALAEMEENKPKRKRVLVGQVRPHHKHFLQKDTSEESMRLLLRLR